MSLKLYQRQWRGIVGRYFMAQALQSRWKLNIIAQNFNIYCQGCHTSGIGQGGKLFKVREKSGIFILSQGKPIFLQEEKSGKIKII